MLIFLLHTFNSQSQTRVIDMHIHCYSDHDFGEREPTSDFYGVKGSPDAKAHRLETFAAFKKLNIVKAMVSGNPGSVEEWAREDRDRRIIKGILMFHPDDYSMDSLEFEKRVKEKKIEVFGEVAPYYMVEPP
jgi:hypothetical protein